MNNFSYTKAATLDQAVLEASSLPASAVKFIGGGTNLIDLMKEDVLRPQRLVDLTGLPFTGIEDTPGGGLRIGALVTNTNVAYHAEIERRYPLLSKAILAGASPQLRNMATTGGNLLQRTRCYYFYDVQTPCNKREPGTGCPAIQGYNRIHAILGTSAQCIATHPSDMCVALAALGATVNVSGQNGARSIPFAEFHRLPGETPQFDNTLEPAEVITSVDLPANGFARNYTYLKLRDRTSYAFALVSVAAALDIVDGRISEARLALGGVAHKPWRDEEAEASLAGQFPAVDAFSRAAETVLRSAQGFGYNNFKIELARRAIVRALLQAAELPAPTV